MLFVHQARRKSSRGDRLCSLGILAATAFSSVLSVAARAQTTFTWTNNAGGDASGSWSVPQNWNNGAGPVAEGPSSIADFSKLNITTDSTVTLDGNHTIGSITFYDTGSQSPAKWILLPGTPAGSTLTLSSSLETPSISGFVPRIEVPLAGKQGLLLLNAGPVVFDAPPGTSTISGTVTARGLTSITLARDAQFGAGASVDLGLSANFFANGHNQTLKNLTISSGGDFDTSSFDTGPGSLTTVSDTLALRSGYAGFTGLYIGQGATVAVGKQLLLDGGAISGPGVLRLGGDVESNGGSISNSMVDLNGATRRFSVSGQSGVGALGSQNGVGGLKKAGLGLLVVGPATYTGPTILEDGRLSISNPASALTLSGGRLLGGAFGGSQLTLGPGGSSVQGGAVLPDTWVRSPGAALAIDLTSGGTFLNSKPLPPVTNATPTTPVLGYAWVKDAGGVGFAYVDGAGHVVRYTAATPISASSAGPSLAMDPATNYTLTLDSNLTLGAAAGPTANSLLLQLGGPTVSRTLNLGGKTLSVSSGGLIVTTPKQDLQMTIDNGQLGASDAELLLHRHGIENLILGPNLRLSGGTGSVVFDTDYNSTAVTTIQNNASTFSGGSVLGSQSRVVIKGGTTSVGGAVISGPLGTGTITFKAGSLTADTGGLPVRLDNPIAVGSTMFVNGSPVTFGGPTTLVGTAGDVRSVYGNVTFEKPIGESAPGVGLAASGGIFAADNTYTGTTELVGGPVTFAARQHTGDLIIRPGGSAYFLTNQHFKTINLAGRDEHYGFSGSAIVTPHGAGPLKLVATESLNLGGAFDLTDNALAVRANTAAGQTPQDLLRDMTILIRNAKPSDTRTGLYSSTADNDPRTALGVMINANAQGEPAFPTLGGETLTKDDVIVRWTLLGDANLDGTVGGGDFNLLASHFGLTDQSWQFGDFNRDGTVGAGDFNLLASNFGQALPGFTSNVTAADLAALQAFDATAAPEPGAAAVLALGVAANLMRRRRGLRW